jgi:hypothetical protein
MSLGEFASVQTHFVPPSSTPANGNPANAFSMTTSTVEQQRYTPIEARNNEEPF